MTPTGPAEPDLGAARALVCRPDVASVLAALDSAGEETRVVGGAVRNALLGREVRDIDLATTALPQVTVARADKAGFRSVPTGISHGTVTVLVRGTAFEVTTLREDVETDGRHAVVRFGRDFAADARRRDFTVNALSLRRDGAIADEVGGLADLKEGRIRFIGEADERIREDYLRVLRFFRFWAEYGRGPVDPDGFRASIRGRDGLARLSRERVRAELFKLLMAPRAAEAAALLGESGLLLRLVGRVGEAGRFGRAAGRGADAVGRLAAFLVRTAEDAAHLRDALRLSRQEHRRLDGHAGALARLVSREEPVDTAEARRLAVLFELEALRGALSAVEGEPRPVLTEEGRGLLARYAAGQELVPLFPVTGQNLLDQGLAPGPALGRRLAAERRRWLAAGCPDGWDWAP